MRLIQFLSTDGDTCVARVDTTGRWGERLAGISSVYDLAIDAIRNQVGLADIVDAATIAESVELDTLVAQQRLLAPLHHPDPARCTITGTGLTHLGSADARDAMHRQLTESDESELTDSMRMFRLGLEGGKPNSGEHGVAPEWFYKGDGTTVVHPGRPLPMPAFADDGGEEAEIVGLYVIDDDGTPCRVGYALGNEFADHVLERKNYLYLAHSKLRPCSFGPELRLGELPEDVRGRVSIQRGNEEIWHSEFASGETNMCHAISNLEHHHFKYAQFRRPGDVHVHFMGAAVLSFSAGIRAQTGDVFRVEAVEFGKPLENTLGMEDAPDSSLAPDLSRVRTL